jgi:hypothetical protein
VVVHDDSKGGVAHAHVTILNHDYVTGKALRDYRVHWQVRRANDELMADQGMQVLSPKPKPLASLWQRRRGELPAFEQQLGDAVTEALADASSRDFDSFVAACLARGVEVVWQTHEVKSDARREKRQGDIAVGVTYKMRDLPVGDGKPGRLRRRKASALSSDLTHDGITAALDAKQNRSSRPVPAPPAVAAALDIQAPATDVAAETLERGSGGELLLAEAPARAAMSRQQVRSILLSRLEGVLVRGLFRSLPTWVRQCATVGILALQHRGDLLYRLQGASHKWDAADLGEQYTASAVSELAVEIGELRDTAPVHARELPIPQLMELLDETGDDDARLPQPRKRRKRETPLQLTPASERLLSRQGSDRSHVG